MIKSIQCQACDKFYDGNVYERCPYCKTENGESFIEIKDIETPVVQEKKETTIKKRFRDKFKKKEQTVDVDYNKDRSVEKSTQRATVGFGRFDDAEKQMISENASSSEKIADSEISSESENKEIAEEKICSETPEKTVELGKNVSIKTVGRFIAASHRENPTNPESNKASIQEQIGDSPSIPMEDSASLMSSIKSSSLTRGIYISNNKTEDEVVYPVVGWIVCVKGEEEGKSFSLKNGRNKIGRSYDMDVQLLNELTVSRSVHASIIYDSRERVFSILPGESNSLCYLNGKAIYERVVLQDYDEIEFGDTEINKYIFVSFCGKKFNWNNKG